MHVDREAHREKNFLEFSDIEAYNYCMEVQNAVGCIHNKCAIESMVAAFREEWCA